MQLMRNWDFRIFSYLNNLAGHSNLTDFVIVFFASYMAYILPIVFLILVLRSAYSNYEKISVISTVFLFSFLSLSIAESIHIFYHRPRPFLVHNVHELFNSNYYSFPSGHAAFFFAFSFLIYMYNKKWGKWFIIASILLTLSRIAAGVHYPTDIIGGLAIAYLVSFFVFRFLKNPINNFMLKFSK
jgi:undecaprenyl-diphosphatase